jgi:hypothetical protein
VTATRDRRSDPELDAEPAWDDRPIIGQFRGLPWWGAVLLAFVPTAIGAFVDMQRQDTLGRLYQIAFVVCCVAAVCLVRRRSLFGPIVQPPLVFALTAIGAHVFLGPASSGGLKGLALSIALPLTSNFPTMGITTAVVVAIGVFRLWWQRDPDPEVRPNRQKPDRSARDVELGLDDEPGQSSGGRNLRERQAKERAAATPPRRGRPEPDDAPEDRPRRTPGRTPRPARESGGGRDGARESGREPRPGRREPAAGRPERADRAERAERGRGEPPADGARGRGRGRPADPQPRRREPGADGGRGREDRGGAQRREGGREGGSREGREGRGTPGRQPRRRPPESYR